jgi:hypothetical protein
MKRFTGALAVAVMFIVMTAVAYAASPPKKQDMHRQSQAVQLNSAITVDAACATTAIVQTQPARTSLSTLTTEAVLFKRDVAATRETARSAHRYLRPVATNEPRTLKASLLKRPLRFYLADKTSPQWRC